MMRNVVVFPHPEGPSKQTTSPAATVMSTSRTAVKVPKFLLTRLSSMVDIRESYLLIVPKVTPRSS
jgi:hypothetical protein